jgi:hypothetical protein
MPHRNRNDRGQNSSLLNGFWEMTQRVIQSVEQASSLVRGADLDLKEKQTVYDAIARLLQQEFSVEFSTCLKAAYQLCQEDDLDALTEDFDPAQLKALVADFQSQILKIQVIYYPAGQWRTFERLVEVFFFRAEQVSVKRVRSAAIWDELPAEMRAHILRQGESTLTFEIYTQEN